MVINGEMHKMVNLPEFFERLEEGVKQRRLYFRSCDNEIEEDNLKSLKNVLKEEIEEKE